MKYIVLLLFAFTNLLYAVVSIAPVEIGEKKGFSFKVETGLESKRGNTDKDNYMLSSRVIYDESKSYVSWVEFLGEYGESNSREDTNKYFSHIRFIHALTDDDNLRYELFSQHENDKFRKIKSRLLGGLGLRYRFIKDEKKSKGYFGLSVFNEEIIYNNSAVDPLENNTRLNSYLSYSSKFSKESQFSCSIYFQPKADDFSDYINTNDLELKFKLLKEIFLKVYVTYTTDSKPPIGVKKYDFTQNTSFVFEF